MKAALTTEEVALANSEWAYPEKHTAMTYNEFKAQPFNQSELIDGHMPTVTGQVFDATNNTTYHVAAAYRNHSWTETYTPMGASEIIYNELGRIEQAWLAAR